MPLAQQRINDLQHALSTGETTALALAEAALARINDPEGEGGSAFLKVYDEAALKAAQVSDTLRAAGLVRSPLEGIPISLKDLFDVKGEIGRAPCRERV